MQSSAIPDDKLQTLIQKARTLAETAERVEAAANPAAMGATRKKSGDENELKTNHYDSSLAEKYRIKKFTVPGENKRSIDVYVYDQTSTEFPPTELAAIIHAESFIAAAKKIFAERRLDITVLDKVLDDFKKGLNTLKKHCYANEEKARTIWKQERETVHELINNVRNNILYYWQDQNNFNRLGSKDKEAKIAEFRNAMIKELEKLTPLHQQTDILLLNQNPSVKSACYCPHGTVTHQGPTGLNKSWQMITVQLDEKSGTLTSDRVYRHEHYASVTADDKKTDTATKTLAAVKAMQTFFNGMRADLGLRPMILPAARRASLVASTASLTPEETIAVDWINVSSYPSESKFNESLLENLKAADAIRSMNTANPIMFCFGMKARDYNDDVKFANERALIQLHNLFFASVDAKLTAIKPEIKDEHPELINKLEMLINKYAELARKHKFSDLFDINNELSIKTKTYQTALSKYEEAITKNDPTGIAQAKIFLATAEQALLTAKRNLARLIHEKYTHFLADARQTGIQSLHRDIQSAVENFQKNPAQLNTPLGQILLAAQDFSKITELLHQDQWLKSPKENLGVQAHIIDLGNRLSHLGITPIAVSATSEQNHDQSLIVTADAVNSSRYVYGFDKTVHAASHASMYSTLYDSSGSFAGAGLADMDPPNPKFAKRLARTEPWGTEATTQTLSNMTSVISYKSSVTTTIEEGEGEDIETRLIQFRKQIIIPIKEQKEKEIKQHMMASASKTPSEIINQSEVIKNIIRCITEAKLTHSNSATISAVEITDALPFYSSKILLSPEEIKSINAARNLEEWQNRLTEFYHGAFTKLITAFYGETKSIDKSAESTFLRDKIADAIKQMYGTRTETAELAQWKPLDQYYFPRLEAIDKRINDYETKGASDNVISAAIIDQMVSADAEDNAEAKKVLADAKLLEQIQNYIRQIAHRAEGEGDEKISTHPINSVNAFQDLFKSKMPMLDRLRKKDKEDHQYQTVCTALANFFNATQLKSLQERFTATENVLAKIEDWFAKHSEGNAGMDDLRKHLLQQREVIANQIVQAALSAKSMEELSRAVTKPPSVLTAAKTSTLFSNTPPTAPKPTTGTPAPTPQQTRPSKQ